MGVVCSSWIFMSRGSTGRSEFNILGRPTGCVLSANQMVSRASLLFWLGHTLGHTVVIEQPASSLMALHPRLQTIIGFITVYKVKTFLGHFRAESPKPIMLLSNCAHIGGVNKYKLRNWLPASQNVTKTSVGSDGVHRVSGDKGLKETQTYPDGFGRAVALFFQEHWAETGRKSLETLRTAPQLLSILGVLSAPVLDTWPDAVLILVLELMIEMSFAHVPR